MRIWWDRNAIGFINQKLATDFHPSQVQCLCTEYAGHYVVVAYRGWSGTDIEMFMASTGPGFSRTFIKMALGIPFSQWGCKRVTVKIAKDNKRSLRLCERFGFVRECELRESDLCIYGLTSKDYGRQVIQSPSGIRSASADHAGGGIEQNEPQYAVG